jgi:hypothetical protein
MNRKDLAQYLAAGASGQNQFVERDTELAKQDRDAALKKYLQAQEPVIAGQKATAEDNSHLNTLQRPELQNLVNDGGSVKAGDIAVGGSPKALMTAGPQEANKFLKTAQGAYKGINDQLDAAKATIDALDKGNAVSDKVALINEARIAAGQGGSRAISHLVDLLSGGQTAASDFQGKVNWLMNTPNIPTLQPAQRNAIREAVHARLPQLEEQHKQTAAQLMQQGPVIAPHADYASLIGSLTTPTQQKLDSLKKMQADYTAQRGQMQPQPPISQPAQANANPTTLDKLLSFFKGGNQPAQPQQAPASGTIRVRHKASGQTGTLPASEFDPAQYEQVQ